MLRWIAKFIFRVSGWETVGEIPHLDKAVFVAAPHTSNWDGFWLLVYKLTLGVEVRFLAKDTLFWWPLGNVLKALGAMPIDREDSNSTVAQLVQNFATADTLFLALAPEGTRQWTPHWKSGFYRIAKAADVPIVLAYIDFGKKQLGVGPTLPDGRSMEEDLATIRAFYAGVRGKHPELQGPVAFPPQ